MNAVSEPDVGKASGVFNTARQLGGVFGIAIMAAVFAAHGSYASPDAFRDGVVPALYVAAGLGLLGGVCGALVPRLRPSPVGSTEPVLVDAGV